MASPATRCCNFGLSPSCSPSSPPTSSSSSAPVAMISPRVAAPAVLQRRLVAPLAARGRTICVAAAGVFLLKSEWNERAIESRESKVWITASSQLFSTPPLPLLLSSDGPPSRLGLFRPPFKNHHHHQPTTAAALAADSLPVKSTTSKSAISTFFAHVKGLLFYLVTFALAVPLFATMLLLAPFVALLDPKRRRAQHFVNDWWAKASTAPFYRVRIVGAEKLPKANEPAVYVANHQSFLDIYTLFWLGRPFKFISKTSNFLIPIIGWSMFLTG